MIFLEYIFWCVLFLLGLNVSYLLIFASGGLLGSKLKSGRVREQKSSYLIMVPGLEHGITIGLMEKLDKSQYTQLQVKEKEIGSFTIQSEI